MTSRDLKTLPLLVMYPQLSRDPIQWLRQQQQSEETVLKTAAAIVLRGFDVPTEQHFKRFIAVLGGKGLDYMYRSSPRTDIGDGVYTATEYPAGLTIPLHNENSFQREWPLRLVFFCAKPATGGGGDTLLADTVGVTKRISVRIREQFMRKQIMYIRNFNDCGIDLSWQVAFQTESRSEVEAYCAENGIAFEWIRGSMLRTRQVRPAFARHPRTRELIWFNQVHAFHPSALHRSAHNLLNTVFSEEFYPRNATYGDGSPVSEHELRHIRQAYEAECVTFTWEAGDILIIDNMLISHGRSPYKGERRLLLAMCDRYCPPAKYAASIEQ